MRRNHFDRIDRAREARGQTPLHETLTAILHEAESRSGVARRIVEQQERLRAALDRGHLQVVLDLEAAYVERLLDAERISFNLGFELGCTHDRARGLGSPAARELAVEVGEVVATSEAEVHEIVVALAAVLAGLTQPFDA